MKFPSSLNTCAQHTIHSLSGMQGCWFFFLCKGKTTSAESTPQALMSKQCERPSRFQTVYPSHNKYTLSLLISSSSGADLGKVRPVGHIRPFVCPCPAKETSAALGHDSGFSCGPLQKIIARRVTWPALGVPSDPVKMIWFLSLIDPRALVCIPVIVNAWGRGG